MLKKILYALSILMLALVCGVVALAHEDSYVSQNDADKWNIVKGRYLIEVIEHTQDPNYEDPYYIAEANVLDRIGEEMEIPKGRITIRDDLTSDRGTRMLVHINTDKNGEYYNSSALTIVESEEGIFWFQSLTLNREGYPSEPRVFILGTYEEIKEHIENPDTPESDAYKFPYIRFVLWERDFAMAVDNKGSLYAWGNNENNQLGISDTTFQKKPRIISNKEFRAISLGKAFSLLVSKDGEVFSSGDNAFGQLGRKKTGDGFHSISGLKKIRDVATGDHHALTLDAVGNVWSWGSNSHAQLGREVKNLDISPTRVEGLQNIRKIFAENNTSFAVDKEKNLYAWGEGFSDTPTLIFTKVEDVASNGEITMIYAENPNPDYREFGKVYMKASVSKMKEHSKAIFNAYKLKDSMNGFDFWEQKWNAKEYSEEYAKNPTVFNKYINDNKMIFELSRNWKNAIAIVRGEEFAWKYELVSTTVLERNEQGYYDLVMFPVREIN